MTAARQTDGGDERTTGTPPRPAPAVPLIVRRSGSADETRRLGAAVGGTLSRGDVVALCGALGAGKTLLTKGIADGLGVAPDEPVVSPTFVLARQYRGRVLLHHLDAYRLADAAELRALGFDEMVESGAVVVEWADRVAPAIPADALWIELRHGGSPDERCIELQAPSAARHAALRRIVEAI